MPKTGTTAIQTFLKTHRAELWNRDRCLVPDCDARSAVALAALDESPRMLRRRYRDAKSRRRVVERFSRVLSHELREYRPRVVAISSEYLFSARGEGMAALRRIFEPTSVDMEVLVYLRSPASFYLSIVQQVLKHEATFPSPQAFTWGVEAFLAAARRLTKNILIRAYEPQRPSGRDIVSDFLGVLGAARDDAPRVHPPKLNVSLCAEQMKLLQLFHSAAGDVRLSRRARDRSLKKLTETLAGTSARPRLRDDIALYVNGRLRAPLQWLKDAHGIAFADVDYTFPDPASGARVDSTDVRDIVSVDPGQFDVLVEEALQQLVRPFPLPRPFG